MFLLQSLAKFCLQGVFSTQVKCIITEWRDIWKVNSYWLKVLLMVTLQNSLFLTVPHTVGKLVEQVWSSAVVLKVIESVHLEMLPIWPGKLKTTVGEIMLHHVSTTTKWEEKESEIVIFFSKLFFMLQSWKLSSHSWIFLKRSLRSACQKLVNHMFFILKTVLLSSVASVSEISLELRYDQNRPT